MLSTILAKMEHNVSMKLAAIGASVLKDGQGRTVRRVRYSSVALSNYLLFNASLGMNKHSMCYKRLNIKITQLLCSGI